jgi:putative membrane protein
MFSGMLIPLALVALIVYFLVRVFRNGDGPSRNGGDADPLKVLKVRYAKGEITREEFAKMKDELKD